MSERKYLPKSLQDAMSTRDTGEAKVPSMPVVKTGDAQIDNAFRKVKEIFDVQNGAAGNKWEKVVRVRDIKGVAEMASALQSQPKDVKPGDLVLNMNGGLSATVAVDTFAKMIMDLPLYKDLIKRLDDPKRFDNLPGEVRDILLKSIADEAFIVGTQIRELEIKHESLNRSIAIWSREITAAVSSASAGVRDLSFAVAERDFAQAGKITQLEASLGNYYQDGTTGRVMLEQQMTVTADRISGLMGQYTVKVQAGGIMAGIGMSASENKAGVADSAIIMMANKFAFVLPTYVPPTRTMPVIDQDGNQVIDPKTGLPMTYNQVRVEDIPVNQGGVPFGIDANGMYVNTTVYIKGSMRVDTGGKTLIDGLRGSVDIGVSGNSWSDTVARQAVWAAIGKAGTATTNNHLVIGDTVMISNVVGTFSFSASRMWNGSAWASPGVIINGDMVVQGSIGATKIDTRGLEIKDASGNIIFSSGVPLNVNRVGGLGALATQDFTWLNNLRWSNGSTVQEGQIVSQYNPIRPENVGTYFSGAIIDTAYIKYGAVQTLQVAGGAVTAMVPGVGSDRDVTTSDAVALVRVPAMPAGSSGIVITGTTSVTSLDPDPSAAGWARMYVIREDKPGVAVDGKKIHVAGKTYDPWVSSITVFDSAPRSVETIYYLSIEIIPNYNGENKALHFKNSMMTATGGKR